MAEGTMTEVCRELEEGADGFPGGDRREGPTPGKTSDGATCLWCSTALSRDPHPGSPRRFCSKQCRLACHAAVAKWGMRELVDGRVSVAEVRAAAEDGSQEAYTLARGAESPSGVSHIGSGSKHTLNPDPPAPPVASVTFCDWT